MNPEIRQKAREDLKGNWGIAIGAMVLIFVISFILNQIPTWFSDQPTIIDIITNPASAAAQSSPSIGASLLSIAISLLVLSVLQVGYLSIHVRIGDYQTAEIKHMFFGFSDKYSNIVITTLAVAVWSFVLSLVWIIPVIIGIFSLLSGSMFFAFIFFLVSIGAGIWSITKLIPLSMIPYILADEKNPSASPVDTIQDIYLTMDGSKMDLFLMGLSFIPWLILVGITFGVAAFYVVPYMQQSYANFYHEHC